MPAPPASNTARLIEDEEVWRERHRQQSEDVALAVEKAKQRKEEEETRKVRYTGNLVLTSEALFPLFIPVALYYIVSLSFGNMHSLHTSYMSHFSVGVLLKP